MLTTPEVQSASDGALVQPPAIGTGGEQLGVAQGGTVTASGAGEVVDPVKQESFQRLLDMFDRREGIDGLDVLQSTATNSLPARGLVNTGNDCYRIVILQSLLSSVPFARQALLLSSFRKLFDGRDGLVIGRAVVKTGGGVALGRSNAVDPSEAMDRLFSAFNRVCHSGRMRQDAQEFFSYVIHQLEGQIACALTGSTNGGAAPEEARRGAHEGMARGAGASPRDEKERKEGKEGTDAVRQKHDTSSMAQSDNVISELFFGRWRQQVTTALNAEDTIVDTSVTSTPFMSIQGLPVRRAMHLEKLLPILTLHLQRHSFIKGSRSALKRADAISYLIELTIPSELVQDSLKQDAAKSGNSSIRYRLNAVVLHEGKSPSGGHYTAMTVDDVDNWRLFDDEEATILSDEYDVLHPPPRHDPYLIFYTRL